MGFRSEDLVILEEDFKKSSDKLIVCTDDGSYGRKGLVTEALKELIDAGNQYDEVFAIGPMVMMKFVSKTTEPYGIPTTVSMSPIMIDGTGLSVRWSPFVRGRLTLMKVTASPPPCP